MRAPDARADTWAPAFERQWAAALEESRKSFSLAALYEVVQEWQGGQAPAPPVRPSHHLARTVRGRGVPRRGGASDPAPDPYAAAGTPSSAGAPG
ncbi:DUF6247 family protein [Streptomyces sp. NPDC018584]|uniref:DUF6247 family protein n=1 Tax=unclassified Streptomyces TaxID=2593676 RepID=UPI0037AAE9A6